MQYFKFTRSISVNHNIIGNKCDSNYNNNNISTTGAIRRWRWLQQKQQQTIIPNKSNNNNWFGRLATKSSASNKKLKRVKEIGFNCFCKPLYYFQPIPIITRRRWIPSISYYTARFSSICGNQSNCQTLLGFICRCLFSCERTCPLSRLLFLCLSCSFCFRLDHRY